MQGTGQPTGQQRCPRQQPAPWTVVQGVLGAVGVGVDCVWDGRGHCWGGCGRAEWGGVAPAQGPPPLPLGHTMCGLRAAGRAGPGLREHSMCRGHQVPRGPQAGRGLHRPPHQCPVLLPRPRSPARLSSAPASQGGPGQQLSGSLRRLEPEPQWLPFMVDNAPRCPEGQAPRPPPSLTDTALPAKAVARALPLGFLPVSLPLMAPPVWQCGEVRLPPAPPAKAQAGLSAS